MRMTDEQRRLYLADVDRRLFRPDDMPMIVDPCFVVLAELWLSAIPPDSDRTNDRGEDTTSCI